MRWHPQLIQTDILAVHAALLHTGEIVFFTGNEFWGDQHMQGEYDHIRLFNCQTSEITKVGIPQGVSDLFCCGHAFFGNGNLMMAGGTKELNIIHHGQHGGHWFGERRSWVFVVNAKELIECTPLNLNLGEFGEPVPGTGGRWYPTLITLGSGQILAIGGHPDQYDYRDSADRPEYFEWNYWCYAEGGRDYPINFDDIKNPLEYPRLHLLPDGKVFSSTPFKGNQVMSYELNVGWKAYPSLTPDNSDWRTAPGWVGNNNNDLNYRIYNQFDGTSVLLPLTPDNNYAAKVMVHGNTNSYVIDLSTEDPRWEIINGRPISKRRLTVNSVILPTGEVFFCGGVAVGYPDETGVNEAEIYNPLTRQWALTPAAQVVRNYHSVALLMPDGRVWVAGSSKNHLHNQGDVPPNPDNREKRIEIFEPWYYGLPTRPIIRNVIADGGDAVLRLGDNFTVLTDRATDIARVAIVRNGSVTHGFNSDQRYVGLTFTIIEHQGAQALRISIPSNPNVVVPGHYMLFLIDASGLPSEGRFININVGWSDWFMSSGDDCVAAPAVASFDINRLEVFARRYASDDVWHKQWDGIQWGEWESLGGAITSAPAAVAWVNQSNKRLDLFVRGINQEVLHKWWDGNNWSEWENLGGPISSDPSVTSWLASPSFSGEATSWGADKLDLFARGMHNELAHKSWDGISWSHWENLGGPIASAPAAVSREPNRIDCFALEPGTNSMIHKWTDGSSWSDWENLGGQFLYQPAACSYRRDRIDLFAIGTNFHLWHRWWDGNSWNFWEDLGGELLHAPSVVSRWFNRIDVIGTGSGGNLMHKYWWK